MKNVNYKKSFTIACLLACVSISSRAAEDIELSISTDDMVLTGSRITQAELEQPDPIIIITADDIREQGFANIYDALNSITLATGQTIGEQFSEGFSADGLRVSTLEPGQFTDQFTANAKEINLRGFGPNRTLVLVNGRRVTHSPIPFDGFESFFDFSFIPIVAVKRIEVVTGGSSAIYGSDAVAGVVNIILNTVSDTNTISIRGGTTTQGGGESLSISAKTGVSNETLNWFLGFQYDSNAAIYGNERDWMDNVDDNPVDIDPIVTIAQFDLFAERFVIPPDGAQSCQQFGFDLQEEPGASFCADSDLGIESIRNQRESSSIFSHFNINLGDKTRLFTEFLFTDIQATARQSLLTTGQLIFNTGFIAERTFPLLETGNQDINFNEQFAFLATGIESDISIFNIRTAIIGSYAKHDESQLQLAALPIGEYLANPLDQIWQFASPEQIAGITGFSEVEGDSFHVGFNTTINTSLGELWDTPIWLSTVLEYSKEGYDFDADQRSLNGGVAFLADSWVDFFSTQGDGKRDQGAVGIETKLPVFKSDYVGSLELQLAARYDFYNDIGAEESVFEGAPTFKLGVAWRPLEAFLIRGTYATNFRAPGMHFVFSEPRPEFISVYDELTCRAIIGDLGENFSVERDCNSFLTSTVGFISSSTELEEEQGSSASFGFVINPIPELTIAMDAYQITLENIIDRQQSFQDLLRIEAECELGTDRSGNAVDANSAECVQTRNQVTRQIINGQNVITLIESIPQATSLLEQTGIDASIVYNLTTSVIGDIDFKLYYSYIDSFEQQLNENDDLQDIRNGEKFNNLRSKFKGVLSWYWQNFDSTLTVTHLGSTLDLAQDGRVDPWTVLNVNMNYTFSDKTTLGFTVNNLLDELPPFDATFEFWPFYNRGQYSGVGREVFVEMRKSF